MFKLAVSTKICIFFIKLTMHVSPTNPFLQSQTKVYPSDPGIQTPLFKQGFGLHGSGRVGAGVGGKVGAGVGGN